MKATIICIGDELLIGQTIDTNSVFIAQIFEKIGIRIQQKYTIGDNKDDILKVLNYAAEKSDIIMITGGLGPTKDDITKTVLCEYFNSTLYFDEQIWAHVHEIFAKMNKVPNDLNLSQATLPKKAKILFNALGTAPGMWFEQEGKIYISLPGVPFEMKNIIENEVIPRLQSLSNSEIIHKYLLTIGIGESDLAKMIEHIEQEIPKNIKLAYLPELGKVKLRLSAYNVQKSEVEPIMDKILNDIINHIPKPNIYAKEDKNLTEIIHDLCKKNKLTISTAESFTAGAIVNTLLSRSGASAYIKGSLVAYQDEIKLKYLNVNENTIKANEVESKEVVVEMLKGCLQMFNSDYAISSSGIAGPTGEKPNKPIGTVYIAVGNKNTINVEAYALKGNRNQIIQRSTDIALNNLRKLIEETN